MALWSQSDLIALRRGRQIIPHNTFTAALCGIVLATIFVRRSFPTANMWVLGVAIGFVWANGFEYALHRWLLHWPNTWTGKGHLLHHASTGQPDAPLYVNLARRPLLVVVMFVLNIWPFARWQPISCT